MRKYLTASLSLSLLSATLVGCGEKSQDVQVSEQLDSLLEQISLLQYADAPVQGNKLEYTLGKEVDGVQIPGSIRFEAAYLDQALALLPQAEEIRNNGTPLQKQSANAIIGSIRADEAAFLMDEAESAFQRGSGDVISLRNKLGLLREIQGLNRAVAGDRAEIIETYRNGLDSRGVKIVGINALTEQAQASAELASNANADLAVYKEQFSKLREKVAEYEALELKLVGQARTSQSSDKFDKLDQATAAAKAGKQSQSQAKKVEIDAWIAERVANLEAYKRQQLAGDQGASTSDLLGKLDGFLAKASQETMIPASSDVYLGVKELLAQAKAEAGGSVPKAAAFMLSMSEFSMGEAANQSDRLRLVAAMDDQINRYLGVIGALEMKVAQINLERQRVSDRLAEIERDRQAVIVDFAAAFAEKDAMIQVAGFDRMVSAVQSLTIADQAVQGSGRGFEMELMSVYMLHARALQQQSLSARSYLTTLSSIAAAGPELLGDKLYATITGRVAEMQSLLGEVSTATQALQDNVATLSAGLMSGLDDQSPRAEIVIQQMQVFQALIDSLAQVGGAGEAIESPDFQTP